VRSASFTYDLPEDRIAQVPAEPRSAARMLVATDSSGAVAHRTVADLPLLVGPGDVVVVNETRVERARLHLTKATGGAVEVLLLEPTGSCVWEGLIRPSRRVPPGTVLHGAGGEGVVEVGERLDGGRRRLTLLGPDVPERHGTIALPPYISTPLEDDERYQTVYAARPGSVAAPTAGLHLTGDILTACERAGAAIHRVDLSIGLDTFRPIVVDDVDDHVMHSEAYRVPEATLDACRRATRVVAVGTTTVRALESAALGAPSGRTSLFIRPGFPFSLVDVLLTNFHMPRSSLLVLLAAFCGERWRALYDVALGEGYRFLSFGDCMLVARHAGAP
jgi:S-adenosylmethionine:tRNA ribosyltransferase-isomerase